MKEVFQQQLKDLIEYNLSKKEKLTTAAQTVEDIKSHDTLTFKQKVIFYFSSFLELKINNISVVVYSDSARYSYKFFFEKLEISTNNNIKKVFT